MQTFWIRYGLGGGFGGCGNWQQISAISLDAALKEAEALAREEYDSYDGMHGLLSVEDIMGEGYDESEAALVLRDEQDSWIEYEAVDAKPEDF